MSCFIALNFMEILIESLALTSLGESIAYPIGMVSTNKDRDVDDMTKCDKSFNVIRLKLPIFEGSSDARVLYY
jgi:hypothetical protein